jgi:hypothetical protein
MGGDACPQCGTADRAAIRRDRLATHVFARDGGTVPTETTVTMFCGICGYLYDVFSAHDTQALDLARNPIPAPP